ncbi:hypothetical protein FHG87_006943 [Trinorchestia longiramus]|nr:hypothetical protein FHG87_006943 [Trinorchestia longiramus]
MALDEDIEVKEEPAEKGDVDEVNSLQLDSTSQSVGVAQVCDFRDASKNSEIRSPVTSSELDVDSEMVMSSQGKRKSKVYQVCPSQSKKKRTKQSLLPSLNIPLAAVGSSSEAEYDLPDETVNLESPSDVSSVGTTSVITSISKHDSGSHSTYVNREQNKCVTGVRASNLSLPRGENDCSVLSPDLEVLEDEIQVLGRRRIRKKKNIQIIDVGGRSSSDIQVLCPVECQNVQVPNLESEPTKKRGSSSKPKAKSKNNVNPYDGNEELVVLDDHCNENEMEKMKNLGTLVSCNAPADDVAACDSSDYVSCDENSDVFCERVSKLGRKKRLVSSPEVEWVLPLQKEVSSTGGQSFEPCVGVEKLGSCVSSSVLETLSSEGLDAPSTSLQKPGNELLSVPSKSVSPKQQLRKKNLTHHASGLGIFGNKSKCKVFVSEDDSLMDTIKKESESEDTDAPDCDVSIFRQTVEAGSALRVLVTDDRFVELSDVLDEEAYNNYLHISCRGGLIRRFFTPVLAAIKESMRIKMNQKKRLLVAVCLGTADIVTFLNDSTSQASGVYSNRPATIALKVAEDLNVFKKAILKEYPSACVLFFKLPKVSKEGNLKIAIDKVNSSIHFLNHQDTQLSFCLAQECPIVPKLSMPQYVLSKNFVTSWFQVCKWYLEVLGHSLEKPSNVSNFDKSLRNKRCVSRDAISSPHVKVVKKPSRLSYVNEHSNIVCHIPKLGPSVEPGATSLMKSSTSDGPDVACIDESESDITIVYTDSDSDAESSITYRHVRAQVAQLESVLRNTTFENRDLSFDINNSLLSSNVCALIAVGRTNGEQVDEKGLLRIACKFKEAEKKNDSAPPSLDAKEKKLIIIAVGKTMEYLEEATLSQAANDLLYTSALITTPEFPEPPSYSPIPSGLFSPCSVDIGRSFGAVVPKFELVQHK